MSARSEIRRRIEQLFILDSELDAFIMDHFFDDVWRSINSRGMSRTEKINQLLSIKDPADIDSLLSYFTTQAATGLPVSSTADSEPLRRENLRLQHAIRELEQQLNNPPSKPTISAMNGLTRIQDCINGLNHLPDGQSESSINTWTAWEHIALETVVCSLGKFHDISCEIRFLIMHNQLRQRRPYGALLGATAKILQTRMTENRDVPVAISIPRKSGPVG